MKNNKNAVKSSRSGGEKELWVDKLAGLVAEQHTVCIGTSHTHPAPAAGASMGSRPAKMLDVQP